MERHPMLTEKLRIMNQYHENTTTTQNNLQSQWNAHQNFHRNKKSILKFMQNQKILGGHSNIKQREQSNKYHTSLLQNVLLSYRN